MTEKKRQGFAVMDPDLQKQIASKGGKAAHRNGTAHQFTSETSKLAASKRRYYKKGDLPFLPKDD